jgi:hypothetical protein
MSSLDLVLQRALSVRLNLQISLSQVPMVEEWMDIHLDRWLEHNPMPTDMPNGEGVSYLAMVGSDLRRIWWGAWGSPGGFVPKMADYFKLCNIAKSDAAVLDQIGQHLEPALVGSWIGVWGGKVTTGWHFMDPKPWDKVETMFGTHEAKYQIKKLVETLKAERIERFSQSIGDNAYSELELAIPGETVAEQVDTLSQSFAQLTGSPLAAPVVERMKQIPLAAFAIAVRIRGGAISRVSALIPGIAINDTLALCSDAKVGVDPKVEKIVGALGEGIARVEYGRAGEHAGVDVYLEPGTESPKMSGAPTTSAN